MILYRITDRIPIVIGKIKIWVSPLTYEQKNNILSFCQTKSGAESVNGLKMSALAFKYSIKHIEGVKTSTGEAYELEYDENGNLSDDSVQDIYNLNGAEKLIKTIGEMVSQGISESNTKGVKIDFKNVINVKKKSLKDQLRLRTTSSTRSKKSQA